MCSKYVDLSISTCSPKKQVKTRLAKLDISVCKEMRYFKILYDFHASDGVELSVKKGDLVCAPTETVEQDGWIKVELASDNRRKGFVPATYVRETTTVAVSNQQQLSSAGGAPRQGAVNSNYGPAMSGGGRAFVPVQQQQQQQDYSGLAPSPAPVVVTPASVTEAFMKNEVYFKQLMKQRQEALAKLEMGLGEAVADIAACKDKNATLARKLRDLDGTIEKERKKWAQRVDEEKILIQRSATTGPSFVAPAAAAGGNNFGFASGGAYGGFGGTTSRSGSLAGQQNSAAGLAQTISSTTTTTTSSRHHQSTANNNDSSSTSRRQFDDNRNDQRY